MEYVLQWHIPNRVLVLNVSGDVSLWDLERFNSEMTHYLEVGTSPVHLVSIGNNIRRVPTNLMNIQQTISYVHHPHMGWTIIVQEKANSLAGFVLSVAAQASGMKMRQVKNVGDGLATLGQLDSSVISYASLG